MSTTTAASGERRRAYLAAGHLDPLWGTAGLCPQESKDDARKVSLERAERLAAALALGLLALEVLFTAVGRRDRNARRYRNRREAITLACRQQTTP